MKQGKATTSRSDFGAKVQPRTVAVRPAGVAQLGNAQGNHVTEGGTVRGGFERMKDGSGYSPPKGPTSSMGQGPGANRTVHPRGSQCKK